MFFCVTKESYIYIRVFETKYHLLSIAKDLCSILFADIFESRQEKNISFKMANCCDNMLKYIVFLFNFAFFATGCILIGIGAYVQIKMRSYFDFLGKF